MINRKGGRLIGYDYQAQLIVRLTLIVHLYKQMCLLWDPPSPLQSVHGWYSIHVCNDDADLLMFAVPIHTNCAATIRVQQLLLHRWRMDVHNS